MLALASLPVPDQVCRKGRPTSRLAGVNLRREPIVEDHVTATRSLPADRQLRGGREGNQPAPPEEVSHSGLGPAGLLWLLPSQRWPLLAPTLAMAISPPPVQRDPLLLRCLPSESPMVPENPQLWVVGRGTPHHLSASLCSASPRLPFEGYGLHLEPQRGPTGHRQHGSLGWFYCLPIAHVLSQHIGSLLWKSRLPLKIKSLPCSDECCRKLENMTLVQQKKTQDPEGK